MDDSKVNMRKYSHDDLIVLWYPEKCTHAGECWRGLGKVFRPSKRPWVDINAAPAEEIIKTIDKCPSGALKYSFPENSRLDKDEYKGPGWVGYEPEYSEECTKITMIRNGPLLIEGMAQIFDPSGTLIKESDSLLLCACGKSGNKPFCDGSHNVN